jgi:transposase InsO family protein
VLGRDGGAGEGLKLEGHLVDGEPLGIEEGFRILEHMKRYMITVDETARRFLVVSRAVRRLIRQMHEAGFGGKKKIAETLLRHAWRVSARTVGRIRKEKPLPPDLVRGRTRPTTVRGDRPNHLWLQDITEIPTLFPFVKLHLMVVLDACSRLPLAATLRLLNPSAAQAVALLEGAIKTHGRPRHLVVDQGSQFKAEEYRSLVAAEKVRIRYGAVGETHSLGLIDRFFRTLKTA